MRDAVIVKALRTPIGKMGKSLATVSAIDLGTHVIKAIIEQSGVDPKEIDEVIFGNLLNFDYGNIARVSVLNADLPFSIPALTVDRQCSSSLNAIALGAMMISTGNVDVVLAGGTESYSQNPIMLKRPERAYSDAVVISGLKTSVEKVGNPTMIQTAENLAKMYKIDRKECDEFAYRSHHLASEAWNKGYFAEQVVNYEVKGKKGTTILVDMDDSVRSDCSMDSLAKLKPVYEGGIVTAGNSSPQNDAASAVLIMTREKAKELGLEILAKVTGFASAGVDPNIMGIGPVYSTRKLLQKHGLKLEDIDLIELNEAFAAQSIPCIRELGIDIDRLNVNGGAIAIGHPLAASGGILVARLVHEMKRRDAKRGLVTFCCGGGQGFSVLFERD